MSKLKTRVLMAALAMMVLGVMFSLAVSAASTASIMASVTTDKIEIYGGGGDGEIRCNWGAFARCLAGRTLGRCAAVCTPCILTPTVVTCTPCGICALTQGLTCAVQHCRW